MEYTDEQTHPSFSPALPVANVEPTFIYKVFLAFGMALLVSALGTYVGFAFFLETIIRSPGILWIALLIELGLIFSAPFWSTRHGLNYFLFAIFALATGFTLVPVLASILVEFGPGIIVKALLATVTTFTAAALIGWTTKKNLLGLGGFFMTALIGLIIVSLIGIFFPWGNRFELLISGASVLLFSGLAAFDLQRIKYFPKDRYIDAALSLFLDIFNLFLSILRLMTAHSRE